MVRYDRQIIEGYVEKRFQASKKWPILYAAIGYVVGSVFGSFVGGFSESLGIQVAAVVVNGLVGLGIGYLVGKEKSEYDLVQAQLVLLQLQIEENIRKESL